MPPPPLPQSNFSLSFLNGSFVFSIPLVKKQGLFSANIAKKTCKVPQSSCKLPFLGRSLVSDLVKLRRLAGLGDEGVWSWGTDQSADEEEEPRGGWCLTLSRRTRVKIEI